MNYLSRFASILAVLLTGPVTAQDAVDGSVPAICTPRSGRAFTVGKTKVACSAVDSSGNTAKTTFTVTVKPR